MDDQWVTTAEIANTLQVHEETVRRWLRSGRLPAVNLGRRAGWRVRRQDLDAFLEEQLGKAAA